MINSIIWLNRIKWSFVHGLGQQLPVLASFLVVARFVDPGSFGIMAIAWVVAGFGQIFLLDTIGDALIREQKLDDDILNSTFWLSLLLGLFLALLTAGSAGSAAWVFGDSRLRLLLQILSLRLVFDALAIVPDALLRQPYALRSLAVRNVVANGAASVVAIIAAVEGFGVWALVAQQVMLGAANAATAWGAVSWRPSFRLFRPDARIWHYFAVSSGYRAIQFTSANLDCLLIQSFLGPTMLGYYSVAQRVKGFSMDFIAGNAMRLIALPLFSESRIDREVLRRAYLKSLSTLTLVTIPCFGGLATVAPVLITTVFGPKWTPAVVIIQILSLQAIMEVISQMNSTLLRAAGKASWWLGVNFTSFVLGIALIMKFNFSLTAVALAVCGREFLLLPLHMGMVRRVCGITVLDYVRIILPPAAATLFMVTVIVMVERDLNTSLPQVMATATAALLGASAYFGAIYCLSGLVRETAGTLVLAFWNRHDAT